MWFCNFFKKKSNTFYREYEDKIEYVVNDTIICVIKGEEESICNNKKMVVMLKQVVQEESNLITTEITFDSYHMIKNGTFKYHAKQYDEFGNIINDVGECKIDDAQIDAWISHLFERLNNNQSDVQPKTEGYGFAERYMNALENFSRAFGNGQSREEKLLTFIKNSAKEFIYNESTPSCCFSCCA